MTQNSQKSKLLGLEALRGGASILVVAHHFLLAFMPGLVGILPWADNSHALVGSPLFAFINGMAAVMAFFVLSGYVLSLKGISADANSALLDLACKRWFRLAPIVTLSIFLSWAIFHLEQFYFADASALSGSDWLRNFAYGHLPQNYKPGFFEALWQGTIGTFIFGEKSLNSNLWTMKWEFFGSYLVFILAIFLRPRLKALCWVLLPALLGTTFYLEPLFAPFVFGILATQLRIHEWKLKGLVAFFVLLAGIYLCGFWHPIDYYGWAKWLPFNDQRRQVLILSIGAFLLLIAFASQNPISQKMNGKISLWLGQISFPLYLVHMLVITSLGSYVYIYFGGGMIGVIWAAVAVAIGCVPLVFIFSYFDRLVLQLLKRWKIRAPKIGS